MRIELENALANKFPFMRVERVWAEDEPRWYPVYTNCGDRWYPHIRDMCREIRDLYASLGVAPDLRVTRIESGYKGLRFTVYFTPAALEGGAPSCRRQVLDILDRYAQAVAGVCERCGRPGVSRENLSGKVLCDSCFDRKLRRLGITEDDWAADVWMEDRIGTDFPNFRVYVKEDQDKTGLWYPFPRECCDGWYYLLYDMAREIDAIYREAGLEPEMEPAQIKEKYGLLRVYMDPDGRYDDWAELTDTLKAALRAARRRAYDTLDRYEDMSEHVCEVCGAPGEYRSDLGWIRSLCDRCYREELKRLEDIDPARDFERELTGRYPFTVYKAKYDNTPIRMSVDCGPGWRGVIHDLCRDIAELYGAAGVEPDLEFRRANRRYGALRLEYGFSGEGRESLHQAVEERIRRAERASEHICEECGAPGGLREDLPLVQTLCDGCHELKKAGTFPSRRNFEDKAFEDELEKKYPFFSADEERARAGRGTRRVFINCRSGWRDLIRESCQEVAELYAAEGLETDCWITDMREEDGALKIKGYWDLEKNSGAAGLEDIHKKTEEILSRCQRRSREICEYCGEPGRLREDLPRPRTLCDSCYEQEPCKNCRPGIPVPDAGEDTM